MDEIEPGGSVSLLLDRLKDGDTAAIAPLWEGYFVRLVQLARERLRGAPRGVADEEDVALSALDSFFRAANAGRFPDLETRESLWRILFAITVRKSAGLVRHECRQKRGGGSLESTATDSVMDRLGMLPGDEPSPDLTAMFSEECGRLLSQLPEDEGALRPVAIWRMEGYSNAEIAGKLGCSVKTVERKLKIIRAIWEEAGENRDPGRND